MADTSRGNRSADLKSPPIIHPSQPMLAYLTRLLVEDLRSRAWGDEEPSRDEVTGLAMFLWDFLEDEVQEEIVIPHVPPRLQKVG